MRAGSRAASGEGRRLHAKIELALPELVGATQSLVTHPRIADLYPEYLVTCHAMVRASIPLMEAALERAGALASDDRVSQALSAYLPKHMAEETGHDDWLLEDLEELGWDRSVALSRPPSTTVASLAGAQYYWILHYHPVALVGFLTALESHPPSREMIDDLIARTGHSPAAFRTLIEHADLDPHHGNELTELVDSLPLTRDQSRVLGLSAMHTIHLWASAIDEIVEEFGEVD